MALCRTKHQPLRPGKYPSDEQLVILSPNPRNKMLKLTGLHTGRLADRNRKLGSERTRESRSIAVCVP
jgi:hypothetical protein